MKKNNLDQIIHDANFPKEDSESATPTDMKAKESHSTSSLNPEEKDKDNFSRQVFRRIETIMIVAISSFYLFYEFHNEIDLYKHQKWQTISIHESLDAKFDHYQGQDGYTLVLPSTQPQSWIYQKCDTKLEEFCELLKKSKSQPESIHSAALSNMRIDYYQQTHPVASDEVILKGINYIDTNGKQQSIDYLTTPPQYTTDLKNIYYYLWISFAVIIANNFYILRWIKNHQNLPKPFIYSTLCILTFYSLYMLYQALNITLS